MIGIAVVFVCVAWLVWAARANHWSRAVAKPLASAGFLLVVVAEPLDSGTRATLIVVGLVFGAIGDVALLGDRSVWFLAGLGAFLAGHLAYAGAFAFDQGGRGARAVGLVVGVSLAVVVFGWLRSHLSPPFTVAVPAYIVVIALMVALAIGSSAAHGSAAAGAVLFAVSDVFVARERFVVSDPINPTIGLPLYYAGQVLIASSAVAW